MTIRELIALLEERLQEVGDVQVEMEHHFYDNTDVAGVFVEDGYAIIRPKDAE